MHIFKREYGIVKESQAKTPADREAMDWLVLGFGGRPLSISSLATGPFVLLVQFQEPQPAHLEFFARSAPTLFGRARPEIGLVELCFLHSQAMENAIAVTIRCPAPRELAFTQ